jgi:hypothetical protein
MIQKKHFWGFAYKQAKNRHKKAVSKGSAFGTKCSRDIKQELHIFSYFCHKIPVQVLSLHRQCGLLLGEPTTSLVGQIIQST